MSVNPPIIEAVCESRLSPDDSKEECQDSTVVTFHLQRAFSQLLSLEVRLPQPGEVRDYLLRYPDLTDLLLPVCEATRQRFGSHAQLSLEVYRDPEIEDEYVTLYVRHPEYDKCVMKAIKEIRTAYEAKLAGKSGWFLLTTDFRPPR